MVPCPDYRLLPHRGSGCTDSLSWPRATNPQRSSRRQPRRANRTRLSREYGPAIERIPDLSVDFNDDGGPQVITLENNADFAPGDQWDNLLDTIGGVNDGAANLFRFNTETNSFDRLSTTFRRPDGTRAGDSQIEPGILQVGHLAFPKAEGRLAIEVTGGGFEAKDNDARVETLLTLKELGVYITIDDFGSGKSSFSDLQDRLVDQVKADPSYIQDAANDPRARKFLSDVITLSNGRGIAVALKGIETAKQLRIAQELSSNLLQGFFLESALPADQVELKFGKRHKSFESGGARAA